MARRSGFTVNKASGRDRSVVETAITLEEYRKMEDGLTRPLTWGPMKKHTSTLEHWSIGTIGLVPPHSTHTWPERPGT